jgi:glucan-binding YG repeat protein
MNGNIKKIIAITLAIGAFSAIAPITNFDLMTTKAYAETNDGVQSIRIKTSSGGSLNVYDDNDYKNEHKVDNTDITDGKVYYAKTSSKKIKVSVDGPDSNYIRVFNDTSSSTKGDRAGDNVDISDSNTIIVRIYNRNPGIVKYSDSDYISQYKFKIKYTSSDDEEQKDNVFLRNISLSSGNISFSKSTSTYDVNVDEDINKLEIGAPPDCDSDQYDNYKVVINGSVVDKDDKFKDKVSLNKGKNVIEIKVDDDEDNERIYTLNVTRADSANASTTNTNSNSVKDTTANNTNNKTNEVGQQINGNMATGWLNYNGSWYYLGTDGVMKIGWKLVSGKYYYLKSDGTMAYSTTINGYKLGADGAWTGK